MKDSFARVRAAVVIVAVFTAGALVGAAWERSVGFFRPEGRPGPGTDPPHRGLPPDFSRKLDLSADQERRIQAILDRSRPHTDSLLERVLPELRAWTDSVRDEIRLVLTPEQRRTFEARPPRLFGVPGGPPEGRPPGEQELGSPNGEPPPPR